jgi:hypothetical protein
MVPTMAHTRTFEEHELQDFTEEGQQIASYQYSTDAEQHHPGTNGEPTKPTSNTSHGSPNDLYNLFPRLESAAEERPRDLSNILRTCCARMYEQIKCSWSTCVDLFTRCLEALKPLVTICLAICRMFGGKIKKVLKFIWENASPLSILLSVVFGVTGWLGFPYLQWSAQKDFNTYCRAELVSLSPSIRK